MRLAAAASALACGACAPLPPAGALFTHGVASGDMTTDSAILWTRTAAATRVVAQVSETAGFERPRTLSPASAGEGSDFTVKVEASGLRPGTRYYYRFTANGATSVTGAFRTAFAPGEHASVRFAFSGDADWRWKPYPIAASLAREELDFFVFLGDLIYEYDDLAGTGAVEGLAGFRAKYRENREPHPLSQSGIAPLRDLYAAFGQYSIFDNHEIALSRDPDAPPYTEGGARTPEGFVNRSPGYLERIRAYREYQPVRAEEIAGTGDARTDGTPRFYRALDWGADMRLLVLDGRSYRDVQLRGSEDPAAAGCARTMLGAAQLRWLQDTLLDAQRKGVTWKVVATPSPIQALGSAAQVGFDLDGNKSWFGGYRCERDRLLAFIDANAIDNVVFVTTDNHYTAINNLYYDAVPGDASSAQRPARNAFEVQTGPLGARAGIPPFGRRMGVEGLPRREADRKALAVLNGESADATGKLAGLAQAGLDPIGLEPGFPGLDVASIRTAGGRPGVAEPLAFASFDSFSYAVLTVERSRLRVQVKTIANVPDPKALLDPQVLREYEARRAEDTLDFVVNAR